LDVLREKFAFEIVAEQEEGYVIVASEDIELTPFLAMVNEFAVQVHGSARIAEVHRLFDDPEQTDRLRRTLSDYMFALWPTIDDAQTYFVDIGIACAGNQEIPAAPKRGKRATDADWAGKELEWSQARAAAYNAWDEIKSRREAEIEEFARFYEAEILRLVDGADFNAAVLPDSFTVRLKIVGRGLKDFVLNYPFVFEVVEPDDIALTTPPGHEGPEFAPGAAPAPPDADAPAVCVIDSGIQEGHSLIQPAIDQATSYCFLPQANPTDVGDFVSPGGHGTRVAGAVLYGETIPSDGTPQLPSWIQNARVLDSNNSMPVEMFPPEVIRAAVERFHQSARQTKIFNHSINGSGYCRTRYMSAWAAEIDSLSAAYDILVVQSAGNLPTSGVNPYIGVKDHLAAGREYPTYLFFTSPPRASPVQDKVFRPSQSGPLPTAHSWTVLGVRLLPTPTTPPPSRAPAPASGALSSRKSSNMAATMFVRQTYRQMCRPVDESLPLVLNWFDQPCSRPARPLIATKAEHPSPRPRWRELRRSYSDYCLRNRPCSTVALLCSPLGGLPGPRHIWPN
jgi:hypothetical protein